MLSAAQASSGRSVRPRRGSGRIIWLVAVVAALADIDVAARQFERRVGANALHLLDGRS